MNPLSRRSFLVLANACALGALGLAPALGCRPRGSEERCPHCGMLIDRSSPFRAELGGAGYDSPRCALASLRGGSSTPGALKVQEFYTRTWTSGADVRFIGGSDVEGPMAAELVPVAPDKVDKFMRDHHGQRAYRLEEVTPEVLKKEGAP